MDCSLDYSQKKNKVVVFIVCIAPEDCNMECSYSGFVSDMEWTSERIA